jgi:hypothetical protein
MTRLRRSTNQAAENHAKAIFTSPFSTASVGSGHYVDSGRCPLYLPKTDVAETRIDILTYDDARPASLADDVLRYFNRAASGSRRAFEFGLPPDFVKRIARMGGEAKG